MAQSENEKAVQKIKDPAARKAAYYTRQRETAQKNNDVGTLTSIASKQLQNRDLLSDTANALGAGPGVRAGAGLLRTGASKMRQMVPEAEELGSKVLKAGKGAADRVRGFMSQFGKASEQGASKIKNPKLRNAVQAGQKGKTPKVAERAETDTYHDVKIKGKAPNTKARKTADTRNLSEQTVSSKFKNSDGTSGSVTRSAPKIKRVANAPKPARSTPKMKAKEDTPVYKTGANSKKMNTNASNSRPKGRDVAPKGKSPNNLRNVNKGRQEGDDSYVGLRKGKAQTKANLSRNEEEFGNALKRQQRDPKPAPKPKMSKTDKRKKRLGL